MLRCWRGCWLGIAKNSWGGLNDISVSSLVLTFWKSRPWAIYLPHLAYLIYLKSYLSMIYILATEEKVKLCNVAIKAQSEQQQFINGALIVIKWAIRSRNSMQPHNLSAGLIAKFCFYGSLCNENWTQLRRTQLQNSLIYIKLPTQRWYVSSIANRYPANDSQ